LEKVTAQARVNYLIALLYGSTNYTTITEFPYQLGLSTIAAETWRNKKGDCLSLAVLAYAISKAIDLPVKIQEVSVPTIFDRQGGIDFVAGHVNLLVKNGGRLQVGEGFGIGDVIIDFEPQIGSRREGAALSEDAILARFYNNLAAEYLAKGQLKHAYSHIKAAIQTDASFAPSYTNLALIYKRQGLIQSAEQLLLYAMALNDEDDIVMSSLHQLLLSQGRQAEASSYAKLLESRREKNPYYWFSLGLDQLQKGNYRQAIAALEQAQARSTGFVEVHRYLAIAYLRNGNQAEAQKQISVLRALTPEGASDAALMKKLKKLSLN
jgi:tetratricopeptide (TPR) repeat protein